MLINEIIRHLESIAPLSYQESYDNAGLIAGSGSRECSGVLVCLDTTEAVILEAINKGCNLVVAHHPVVFSGLKKFNGNNYVERTLIKAIRHDIAVYAIHTNLDNVIKGVNGRIADKLELKNRKILLPGQNDLVPPANVYEETGSGVLGELAVPMEEMAFLSFLKSRFDLRVIKHTALLSRKIKKVALCGGAGSFLISKALGAGADIFITSDIKYHEFFDANGALIIADIGHYESEQFTIDLLSDILQEKFPTFAVLKTEVKTNPVQYFL